MKITAFNRTDIRKFSDEDLKQAIRVGLINCATLEELYLNGTSVTVKCLQELDAPNLIALEIGVFDIENSSLKVLAEKFPKLKRLRLSNSQVTGGFEVLAALPLESLDVSCSNVGDDAVEGIATIASLQTIYLHGTKVTEKGVSPLFPHGRLTRLDLRGLGIYEDEKGARSFEALFHRRDIRIALGEYYPPNAVVSRPTHKEAV